MNVHKGWACPRGIYSEVHSPITTPEIICVMALTLQPIRGCPQHSGETGTRLSSAIQADGLLSRFFPGGGGGGGVCTQAIWKWYNSKVFDRRLYGVGQRFTFCRFSRKRRLFGNFDCDFWKCFTKGFFCDWIWRISKFPFWRQILEIYRQRLLNSMWSCLPGRIAPFYR